MIHRYLRFSDGWEWHILHLDRSEQQDHAQEDSSNDLKQKFPEAYAWIESSIDRTKNNVVVAPSIQHGIIVHGTLMIQASSDHKDVHPFHFWLSSQRLITMHNDDFRLPILLQKQEIISQYETCKSAPEAFFIMIGSLLENLQKGLDLFQLRLGSLEKDMRERNRRDLLDEIIECRYELLHYNHLYLPIRELEGALKEAFMEHLTDTEGFARIHHRFKRIDTLLTHYALEIDTLISVDDALSNFKGNEIVRTLTIFTVIFLPATVLGALWGSNFEWLPFKEEPLGFLMMIAVVFVITSGIYIWLWRKGWTGDILSERSKTTNKKIKPVAVIQKSKENETFELPKRNDTRRKLFSRRSQPQKQVWVAQADQATLSFEDEDKPLPSRSSRKSKI